MVRRASLTITLTGYQIAASTPLQMMLYFSVPYGVLWAIANQMLFYWKASTFDVPLVVAVVSPMMFWIWFLLEPIRILLGCARRPWSDEEFRGKMAEALASKIEASPEAWQQFAAKLFYEPVD